MFYQNEIELSRWRFITIKNKSINVLVWKSQRWRKVCECWFDVQILDYKSLKQGVSIPYQKAQQKVLYVMGPDGTIKSSCCSMAMVYQYKGLIFYFLVDAWWRLHVCLKKSWKGTIINHTSCVQHLFFLHFSFRSSLGTFHWWKHCIMR